MYCRKCGAELDEGARFCGSCGSKVEVSENGMLERICPACGERVKISQDYPFCSNCGKDLGSSLLNKLPTVQVRENKAEVINIEEDRTQEMPIVGQEEVEEVICPNCGRKVQKSAHMHICMYCGAELSGTSASDDHDKKELTCSKCGRRITVTKDMPYCQYCGNDMSIYISGTEEEKSVPVEPEQEHGKETDYSEVKEKKGKKGPFIVIFLLAAACAVLVVFLVFEHTSGSSTSTTANKLNNKETTVATVQPNETEKPENTEKKAKATVDTSSMKATSKPITSTSTDYIIPDSSTRLLTDSDVEGLSLQKINYAKNEIYARHGRKFNSSELQDYFNSKSWYNGTIEPDDFTNDMLSSIEQQNVEFLSNKEHEIDPNGYTPK